MDRTGLFDAALFVLPQGDGASLAPRAILSQTIYAVAAGAPYYELVFLGAAGPWGAEDQAPADDGTPDLLVRCVHVHP